MNIAVAASVGSATARWRSPRTTRTDQPNYADEHHLFPSMPRANLRQAQPLVRVYCAETACRTRGRGWSRRTRSSWSTSTTRAAGAGSVPLPARDDIPHLDHDDISGTVRRPEMLRSWQARQQACEREIVSGRRQGRVPGQASSGRAADVEGGEWR